MLLKVANISIFLTSVMTCKLKGVFLASILILFYFRDNLTQGFLCLAV